MRDTVMLLVGAALAASVLLALAQREAPLRIPQVDPGVNSLFDEGRRILDQRR